MIGVHRWDVHNCRLQERERNVEGAIASADIPIVGSIATPQREHSGRSKPQRKEAGHGEYKPVQLGEDQPAQLKMHRNKLSVAVLTASVSPQAVLSGTWTSLADSSLVAIMLPSLANTVGSHELEQYNISLYVAFDDDDLFWVRHAAALQVSGPLQMQQREQKAAQAVLTSRAVPCCVCSCPVWVQTGYQHT